MRIYLAPPKNLSQGIQRVARALAQRLPDPHAVTTSHEDADLLVLHVIGWGSLEGWVREAIDAGRPYAIIQYCLRTTEDPRPDMWWPIWDRARAVWSYYDLCAYADAERQPWFYHAPMGVDPDLFPLSDPGDRPRKYGILTSGYIADTEAVTECAKATWNLGQLQAHLGPFLNLGSHVHHFTNVTDQELACYYRASRYVAGLRRIEGFEMPALEGLLSGARPIMFDQPHYRDWFSDSAIYIAEREPKLVQMDIEQILQCYPTPVTPAEREQVAARFSWDAVVTPFWTRVLA